jgi:Zn-dependent protease with chaperone function
MSSSPFLPFALHGATLALAWFFIVNVMTSAMVAVVTHVLARRAPRVSAGVWFALRLLPAASAALFVAAMFLPSYWKYEPVDTEGFDVTLTICGAAAIAVLTAACVRGFGAWRGAAERTRTWTRTARPVQLPGTAMTAFEIAADAPMMALAGIFRPRLFVTRGLIDALTPEELAASVAHEVGHSHGRDNLKRLLMRAAPDVFTSSRAARTLERSWAASAEHRADQLGSGADPSMRCALASALVKVARLRPSATPAAEPISTLVGGGDVTSRVRSLLDAVPASGQPHGRVTPLLTCASIVAAAAAYVPLLIAVHEATEALVRLLP